MFRNSRIRNAVLQQRKKIAVATACVIMLGLSVSLLSYKNGPAKNGQAVTGAPFNNNQTCTKCHSGGNFGGSIGVQLQDSAKKAVTSYVPGRSYTLRININKTSTASAKYGFQTTCAKTTGGGNINKWGTLPANTHVTLLSAHHYVEQSTALTNKTILIPWTGPAKGSGSVTFYTSGNIVNNNGSESGDQPVHKNLVIAEGVALLSPVVFSSYQASLQNNNAVVNWSTTKEDNITRFILEKSSNGTDFTTAAAITAKGWGSYSFTDYAFSGKAYYRLKMVDIAGNTSNNEILTLVKPDKNNYSLRFFNHAGTAYFIFANGARQQKIQVTFADLQGHVLSSGITLANEGDNALQIPQVAAKGMGVINVVTEDGIRTTMKFMIKP